MGGNIAVIAIAISYFVLMIVIGVWANRRTSSSKEFLAAGQSLGFFVMAIAAFSSIQSGWGMVGSTGTTYAWGVQGIIAGAFLIPLGFALAWFLLGARLRRAAQRHEIYSVPDFIKVRYDSRAAHLSISIAVAVGSIAYMTAQIGAMGIIMSVLFGIPAAAGAWIGAAIVGGYTVAGGMLAAVWSDLVQGLLMVAMSIAVFIAALSVAGGWGDMLGTLSSEDSGLVSATGVMPVTWIIASAFMLVIGIVGQPQLVHKFLMLSDETQLRWGATTAGLAYAVTTLFSLGVGLAVRAQVASGSVAGFENLDDVTPYFLTELVSPVLGGLALTALLAAIMSSASSFITIGASALTRDLAGGLGVNLRRELLWGRVAAGVVVLSSVTVTLYLDQIVYLAGAFGWAFFAAAIFAPVVFGLYWRRATGVAATTTIIAGLLINGFLTVLTAREVITLPEYFFIGGFVVAFCILLFIVVSYLTSSTKAEERFATLYPEVDDAIEQSRQANLHTGGSR